MYTRKVAKSCTRCEVPLTEQTYRRVHFTTEGGIPGAGEVFCSFCVACLDHIDVQAVNKLVHDSWYEEIQGHVWHWDKGKVVRVKRSVGLWKRVKLWWVRRGIRRWYESVRIIGVSNKPVMTWSEVQ